MFWLEEWQELQKATQHMECCRSVAAMEFLSSGKQQNKTAGCFGLVLGQLGTTSMFQFVWNKFPDCNPKVLIPLMTLLMDIWLLYAIDTCPQQKQRAPLRTGSLLV